MPTFIATFLIDFAILLGSTDPAVAAPQTERDVSISDRRSPKPPSGPSDRVRGCAPDADMCNQVGAACIADGLDPEVCDGFRVNICPADRSMSCKALEKVCDEEGYACDAVRKTCDENLEGCPASKCHAAGTLSPAQAVATCFAYPWTLDSCEGGEPDAGHCMSLLTWDECGIDTCQWIECAEELALLGDLCPLDVPEACEAVVACDDAENNGW